MADNSDWVPHSYTGRIKRRPTEYLQRDEAKQIPEAFAALVDPLNEREEVEQLIYETQSIYLATGIELDRFGEYVDLPRGVMADDEYRQEILRIRFTASGSGTEADLTKLAQAVSNYGETWFIEHYPAAYIMHISSPVVPKNICIILDKASIGGVRAYSTHDYGDGGFALAGINTATGKAMKVAPQTAMQVAENTALGLNRGAAYLGGSMLASAAQVSGSGYHPLVTDQNDEIIDGDENVVYVGTADYDRGGAKYRLCGAMPKEG